MKKKTAVLALLIALLAVLGIIYMLFGEKPDESASETDTTETADTNAVIKINDGLTLSEVTAHRNSIPDGIGIYEPYDLGDSVMRIYLNDDDSYFIDGYEDMALSNNIGEYIDGFYSLPATYELKEHDALSVYGLDSPALSFDALYSDKSSLKLSIGNKTADGEGFYACTSASDSVYVITSAFAEKYFYGLNDLLDKSLTEINKDEITLVSLTDKTGAKDLLITYDTKDSATEGNELTPLIMRKPKNGLSVYPYNLQTTILGGQSQLRLVDIVEIHPSDLSRYGLDEPSYELTITDTEKSLALDIGNEADDTYTYCKLPDKDTVYTVFTAGIDPAINYNIYEFVERFVDLKYRRNVESVHIEGVNTPEYTLTFGDDKINKEGIDNRTAAVNGKEYDREGISDFYQLLVGITFERIEEDASLQGEPELTITFNMLDGSVTKDAYYGYDSNYYIVEKDGENTGFIVSRSYLSRMLAKAAEMVS